MNDLNEKGILHCDLCGKNLKANWYFYHHDFGVMTVCKECDNKLLNEHFKENND